MSKNAVQSIETLSSNSTLPTPRRFSSQILAEEMEGYNLVASMIPEDIFTTVEAINASMTETIQVQTKHRPSSYGLQPIEYRHFFRRVIDMVDSIFGLYTLLEYYVKQRLVSDNFYAYSQNRTLLEMPIEELRKIEGIRVRYL